MSQGLKATDSHFSYRVLIDFIFFLSFSFFLNCLLFLIGGKLLYNIVVVFAIHWHESDMGVHVSHHPEPPSHFPPHAIPLGCPRVPALGVLFHASNLHWSSCLVSSTVSAVGGEAKVRHRCERAEESGGLTNVLWRLG